MADLGGWKPNIDGLIFERLEELDVEGLEKPFSEEEIFGALSSFCGEKRQALTVSQWRSNSLLGIL